MSLTDMQGLMTNRWSLTSDIDQWTALRQVIAECNPQHIGVNTSDVIWAADGLTFSLYNKLKETLGAELSSRITSAEPLAIRWLETRTAEELALYTQACAIAHAVMKRGFSRGSSRRA